MDKSSALEYINQMFPTEASLSGVEPLMQQIQSEIHRVDGSILAAVRRQSYSGTKAKEDLAAATHAVQELMHKIHEIKTKAEQSETMVQEICHDIKKLDFAKRHITTTITALHRLTMLVSAVEQLQVMASKRQYKEAAAQLEAVNQLCSHFEAYRDVPKIAELREKFKNIKKILKSHVFSDFSSLGTGKETEETNLLQQLSDACLVVDALEPSVREELVKDFCQKELTSYRQIFEGAELAKLDKTERRYAWIKRRLRTNEDIWNIFPSAWHVDYLLCIQFCKLTSMFGHDSDHCFHLHPELSADACVPVEVAADATCVGPVRTNKNVEPIYTPEPEPEPHPTQIPTVSLNQIEALDPPQAITHPSTSVVTPSQPDPFSLAAFVLESEWDKLLLWQQLTRMGATITEKWFVGRDLNMIMSPSEKWVGAKVDTSFINRFCEHIEDAGLYDLGYSGPPYT
ncbi:vacuolar protein sorting-associated protein 53 A-like [Phalaenopsis equestris]|uniref:vacuolar protein sorting-associated protein 53 A-like n=1 Tax=Phalaenopsis equestris TaxID=78828 RepID=UPI0009E51670|nr:vacuolar protein sorting-associated protein 53 A-like [Phalaenopsis equestris]